jgi:cation:H+ antiporter
MPIGGMARPVLILATGVTNTVRVDVATDCTASHAASATARVAVNWADVLSLPASIALLLGSALAILVLGTRLTRIAARLADTSGLGQAVVGSVLLGGATSLAGIATSLSAAFAGHPQLAVSNAVGGIAAQTAFVALADMAYRPGNLEHAAASVENLISGAVLCGLLSIVLIAALGPDLTVWGVHPASILILGGYLFGLMLARRSHEAPAWQPEVTDATQLERVADGAAGTRSGALEWLAFATIAVLVTVAGYLVAVSGIALIRQTGLSETIVGGLFTAVATSLPELVTSIAAVRQGAPTLAIGGIIGGNTFDVLFVTLSDMAYRPGSIYHAIDSEPLFVVSLTILMTSVLLLGLLHRERRGVANIGFEGALVLLLYAAGFVALSLGLVDAGSGAA